MSERMLQNHNRSNNLFLNILSGLITTACVGIITIRKLKAWHFHSEIMNFKVSG